MRLINYARYLNIILKLVIIKISRSEIYMYKYKKSLLLSLMIFAVIIFTVTSLGAGYVKAEEEKSLLVYSGAGLRKPMNDIGKAFEEEYGVQINYTYGGSAHILSQLQLAGEGDIYIPGARYYYEKAKEKGLTTFEEDVAYHIPVIAVPKGNPANIKGLDDLCRDDVEIVLGDEKSAAIGRLSQKILSANNLAEGANKNVIAKAATVNELVIYITMKQADGAIIWEDNVYGIEDIDIVRIAKDRNKIKTIPVCVLSLTEKNELAMKFAKYVASEKGKSFYIKHGFKPVE